MADVRQYSNLFACLYDEPAPIGALGRGTHYSVFRCIEWLDVTRRRLDHPQIHDFAVIWDEDHDERVIEAVERIYMAGLLSPVQFIGERKGGLTAIVAAKFYFSGSEAGTAAYRTAVEAIVQGLDDPWPAELGSFDRSPGNPHQNFFEGLIQDSDHRVGLYLGNIDSLWGLGTKPYLPAAPAYFPPPIQPTTPGVMPPPPSPPPARKPFPPMPLAPRS
ncbi:hypothetical protein [Bradyrhizobium genomosp. I (2014)]|uniref:hypothetical protein n=1 Tax=Bradyrhizobium genomosp. I (2014) TaxID=2683269 RepID=UPI0004B07F6E|nr:hypothetical protein [Bradyrhizobium sp. CCBAU 43298]